MKRRIPDARLQRALNHLLNPDGKGQTRVSFGFTGDVHTKECWDRQREGHACDNCQAKDKQVQP